MPDPVTTRRVSEQAPQERETVWARRGAQGDRNALSAIVRTYQDRVYRVLYRLSNDRELALDLSQETFLKAFAALARFRDGSSLGPWLMKIANNLFIDHVRARKTDSLDAHDEDERPHEPGGEDPAYATIVEEADVFAALAQLPVQWRQAVVLRHLDDLSYDEIAQVLEVPIGTAKTWLFRGRERLRELLEKGGITP